MIKVVIAGADSLEAGELIRILVNHPDVAIEGLIAAGHDGTPVTAVHHGLIGESAMTIDSSADFSKCDVLFVCGGAMAAPQLAALRETYPELKIIVLSHPADIETDDEVYVYGLPELNRKKLVRGAKHAVVPRPAASLAVVSLLPLARHQLLKNNLDLKFWGPEDVIVTPELDAARSEIFDALRGVQIAFTNDVKVAPVHGHSRRGMMLEAEIDCDVDLAHLLEWYDEYDDHNFAYAVTSPLTISETVGTERIVISLQKPTHSTLHITAVGDARMRGGAGEAVHLMNLLCGLYEKTGLALKASYF